MAGDCYNNQDVELIVELLLFQLKVSMHFILLFCLHLYSANLHEMWEFIA